MKITFIGTGAADWDFYRDGHLDGYRRNASALLDDIFLIDPGPLVLNALETFGKDPNKILYIINTHKHPDHYNEDTIEALKNAKFYYIAPDTEIQIGKYFIKALKGNHATCNEVVHFIISDGEKKLFYGLDSSWLMYNEFQAIKNTTVDYAVFDGTLGDVDGDFRIFEHNNLRMIREMKLTLEPYIKRFCISHMAKETHLPHNELAELMNKVNIETSFDGYETEI